MKKLIFAALAVLLIGADAMAQFEIRPLVGLNFGNVQEEPDGVTTSAKAGYQFGGHVLIGGKFHFYPGITYGQQVVEYVDDAGDVTIDQTIAGVEIPLLVGYRFIDPETENLLNLRVFAGPAMTFHTKTEYSESFVDDQVDWKSMAWAARVGAGIDIAFLFVDLGYEIGLTDVHDVDEALDSFSDTKHNSFVINAGIKISL
jgi:hypothetical protein